MTEWLASGMRRDICVLLYGEERSTQKLKSALQDRYDRRIRPKQFRGALRALEDDGYVEKRVDGLADVFSLTEAGERGVERQYEWLTERVS
ncbi:PadR family transcriptional regulator [Halorarius litoreus]|uniref:PadR family transcriptional regulator n=1 Tax=Halorarius litoreus TaxID=2962676 RepID=UPI0020CFB6E9|nr:PadR family transcriptional regulator [Halorarius litoreus]